MHSRIYKFGKKLINWFWKVTKTFPQYENFGLISQLRRAATSIPANIVEGYKRKTKKDFAHFLNIADSSLEETKYHLLLACDLSYLAKTDFDQLSALIDEVGRMLYGFQEQLMS